MVALRRSISPGCIHPISAAVELRSPLPAMSGALERSVSVSMYYYGGGPPT
ncbi:MAG: hypothetical protein ACYDHU_09130 [Acidimicrobiales bacterium]